MKRERLRSDVRIVVEYQDNTLFGGPIGRRADQATLAAYTPVVDRVREHGTGDFMQIAPELLAVSLRTNGFATLTRPDGPKRWSIKSEVLYPEPEKLYPKALWLECETTGGKLRANVPAGHWPIVHELVARLNTVGCSAEGDPDLHSDQRALLDAMRGEQLLEDAEDVTAPLADVDSADLTFVGHNTVVVRSGRARVLVDPLLFPASSVYPARYQPLTLADVGAPDAVLITHSHPDHFDPASLLRIPPATRIIVPYLERETLLAVAMADRLRQLGFTRVTSLEWGQAISVGDIEIFALPFFGEQPTDSDVLHPTVRNNGNTYVVRTPTLSAAFLADSGHDAQGDVKQVATRARSTLGPVDVVFAGYRGWFTYPAQHLLSSVTRFMLFVPPELWGIRQKIMIDADDAVDVAERWGARFVAGYADGGAPWYWHVGLGPRLDDDQARELSAFDPFPEWLGVRAATRSQTPDGLPIRSPVRPLLIRPGDSLRDIQQTPTTVRVDGHSWPYAERRVIQPLVASPVGAA
jgi:L-ascorbate metabolism protein UlaG (beta-lactamase superfamily)